jgi:branched-chain amino acid aminotransferase
MRPMPESMSIEFQTLPVPRRPAAEREQLIVDPAFGTTFTDHMITIRWREGLGWHDARLEAYGPLSLDPSAQVFHYGQEVFEGMKANRRPDGSLVVFRPFANAERLNRSCARMAMPELPEGTFVEALELLVGADRDWVPGGEGQSLYLRPFMIATEATIGFFGPAREYLFCVIASPAGAYFSGNALSVWLTTEYSRAAPGGTGEAKCGGNYAGTLLAQREAARNGCDQVVWLDAVERRWIEEMGTSNLFFVYGQELVTPRLTGTLLAGVNRDSILTLAGDLGLAVREDRISVEQWRADAESGRLTEVFSCGTSSMVTPVGRALSAEGTWTIGDGGLGPVAAGLRAELAGIKDGTAPDRYGWIHKVA